MKLKQLLFQKLLNTADGRVFTPAYFPTPGSFRWAFEQRAASGVEARSCWVEGQVKIRARESRAHAALAQRLPS